MKITDKVYLVGGSGFGYSAPGDCNIYMVDCGGKLAIVDTGGGRGISKVLSNVKRMGFNPADIEMVFLTHCHFDHIGGNADLYDAVGCKFAAHKNAKEPIETLNEMTLYSMGQRSGLEFEPVNVDKVLDDGDSVTVGDTTFKTIHIPGHTPGGIAIALEEDEGMGLFPGDSASAQGSMGYVNGPGFNMDEWKASIRLMVELKPHRLYPGHGTFAYSGATECLKLLDRKWNSAWTTIITSG